MMTQLKAVVAQEPVNEVSPVPARLTEYLEQQGEAIAQTEETAGSSAVEPLLPIEEIAITSGLRSCDHHMIAPEILKKFRRGYGEHAVQVAQQIKEIAVTSAEGVLRKARLLLDMKLSLNRKEWGIWLREVLGWFNNEATPYLQIAKAFKDFEPRVFSALEPFTILNLRTKRYAPVVARLGEEMAINSNLIQNFIKEVIPKQSKRKPSEPISGWKQNRAGGSRRYEVILHDEQTGLAIEQQAETEGTLPQKVIAEAVALRAKQKSGSVLVSGYRAAQLEELHTVVDNGRTLEREKRGLELELAKRDRTIAELEAKLTGHALLPAEMCSEELIGLNVDQELEPEFLEPLHSMGGGLEAQVKQTAEPESADFPELAPEEDPIQLPEAVERVSSTAITQAAELSEPVQEIVCLELSADASANDCQLITPAWEQLKQLRGAEAGLRKIDNQIKELNDKLANLNSGEIVKRELSPVLKKQLNLRSAKISEIVETINSNSISAYYEEVENVGRVVLNPKYASEALKQAKSWADVVLVVACDRAQLLKAVDTWTLEQRQVLVQLLSTYLETEPSHLEHVAWIPKTLLQKVLTNLSFKIRKIGGPNNLVDEPKIEYVSNCNFISLEYPGTNREQWIFQDRDNKRYSVFGRDEIEIEKF